MKMSGRILYGLQKERDAAVQANAPLRERIRELTAKVKELEAENSRNIRKIETMTAELRELRNKEVERVAVMAWVSSVIGDDAETVAAGHIRAERERLRREQAALAAAAEEELARRSKEREETAHHEDSNSGIADQ